PDEAAEGRAGHVLLVGTAPRAAAEVAAGQADEPAEVRRPQPARRLVAVADLQLVQPDRHAPGRVHRLSSEEEDSPRSTETAERATAEKAQERIVLALGIGLLRGLCASVVNLLLPVKHPPVLAVYRTGRP